MSLKKGLIRFAGIIALFTLISRVLGLVRDVGGAHLFGASEYWDAFVFAWMLPNLFRHLLGEGALSAAFVPVFSDYLVNKSKEETWRLASVVATLLAVVLIGLVVAGELISIPLELIVSGGSDLSLQFILIRILFPYVALICFVAFMMGMLNSLDHFAAPAFAPVILNVFWIAGVFAVAPLLGGSPDRQIIALAVMLLVGGVAQVLMQVPPLLRKGVRLRPCFDFRHPGLKQILLLIAPMMVGLAPMQVNVLLDNVIARTMGQVGANSVFFYSNRLMQFPLALIGIAMGTAVFPLFSRYSAANERGKLRDAAAGALRLTLFMSIPASVGLAILGGPIIRLFFEHGRFGQFTAERTALALLFYASGVWAFCSLQIVTRLFYARKDSKTPVKVAVAMVGLNLVLNLLLIGPLDAAGLALATTVSQTANLGILLWLLRRRGEPMVDANLALFAGKVILVAAAMGGVCVAVLNFIPDDGTFFRAARVFAPAIGGLLVFACAARLLRLGELGTILGALFKRKTSPGAGDCPKPR